MPLKDRSTPGTLPTSIRRIYLTGFMGAGKSTVGAILASQIGWRFFDTDLVIEAKEKASVSEVFAEFGEQHFRQLEVKALLELRDEENAVISLGGGSIETSAVRDLLADDPAGNLVFLEAPFGRLIDRCVRQEKEGATRPLLHDEPLLQTRYESRLTHYRTAHLTVATQDLNPEETAAAIVEHMAAFAKWK